MFHRLLRHIRRSHQASVKQLYNHALLPCNSCHSAMNAFEFAFCHNYVITKFKLDIVRGDWDDVWVLDGGETDEVVYGFIFDSEWWIAVGIVLAMDGVIEVVAE